MSGAGTNNVGIWVEDGKASSLEVADQLAILSLGGTKRTRVGG